MFSLTQKRLSNPFYHATPNQNFQIIKPICTFLQSVNPKMVDFLNSLQIAPTLRSRFPSTYKTLSNSFYNSNQHHNDQIKNPTFDFLQSQAQQWSFFKPTQIKMKDQDSDSKTYKKKQNLAQKLQRRLIYFGIFFRKKINF